MARTGRPRAPTKLKEIRGTARKDRLVEHEPQPSGTPDRPSWLNVGARQVWDEYAPILIGLGVLTTLDGAVFGMWCSLMAEFRTDATMSANRIARLDAIGQQFGMTPSSRSRISVKPTTGKVGKERFFAG